MSDFDVIPGGLVRYNDPIEYKQILSMQMVICST